MPTDQFLSQAQTKLSAATQHYQDEINKLRTGRAHPSMLDNVMVQAYGQPMPLKAVGSVAAPEAQLLQITPYDVENLQAISNAIRDDQSLDLSPTDDGRVVRIQLPPMTTENRQAMVKNLHAKLEEALISSRNIRHEAIQQAEQAEKAKDISRDDLERFKKHVDELIAKQKSELETLTATKEKDIMTV